jgi:integrase/recombinase XerD
MTDAAIIALKPERALTAAAFQGLAAVPAEAEWFANLGNNATRRAYQNALQDFMRFVGISRAEEFRAVTRAHVIAWRDELQRGDLGATSVRHRLSALASLFEYLCEKNAVSHNPVKGVKRPPVDTYEGKTPVLGDHQVRRLLAAPDPGPLKGQRDRAILATLLYHALRRNELCRLNVQDFRLERRGVPHLKISGKGGKTRYVPLHPVAGSLIVDYLEAASHCGDAAGALFRPLHHNREVASRTSLTPDAVYKIVREYSGSLGFKVGAHSLRATAATNALQNSADLAKTQVWLGHSHIGTTRLYDHRAARPEDSPTFKVAY